MSRTSLPEKMLTFGSMQGGREDASPAQTFKIYSNSVETSKNKLPRKRSIVLSKNLYKK